MLVLPYQGNYKQTSTKSNSNKEIDEYDVIALAKRLNITFDDMKEMSFVSLMNILLSSVEEHSDVREGTEEDARKYFG